MEQGSPSWYEARRGKVTASRFGELLVKGRGDKVFGESATSYMLTLVGERLSGIAYDETTGTSPACQYGHEFEPQARAAYQWKTGRNVAEFGFYNLKENPSVGGSVDGAIVNEPGIVEIKCPWTCRESTRTIYTGQVPKKYTPQIQGLLWVTGREWCDYVSYDFRLPKHLELTVIRVERDQEYIENLASRVLEFAKLVADTERALLNGEC